MISFISLFEITYVVTPDPRIALCIPGSADDAVVVNPNGIKTLLTNGLSTFFIKGKSVFSNGPKSPPENPPDCTILDS